MADLANFIPIVSEPIESIRARVTADRNAGLAPTDPDYVDDAPGGFISDLQDAVLLEIERLYDFLAVEVPAVAFIQSAYGSYLDDFGEMLDVPRKDAVDATGEVTFTGTNGTWVFTGTRVGVPSPDPESEEVEFEVTADGEVADGTVTLPVRAITAGSAGNVAAAAISLRLTPVENITGVTNADPTSGGTDVESDEAYSARLLLEFPAAVGAGTRDDYRRWALAYPGVGFAAVEPLWDGAGTVRVVVTDAFNNPCSAVVVAGLQDTLDPPQAASVLRGQHILPTGTIYLGDNRDFLADGKVVIEGVSLDYTGKADGDDEVQQLTVDATNGTYTLTFSELATPLASETTTGIAPDATASELESALEALSSIGANNVTVTGGPGDAGGGTPYEVTFVGELRRKDVGVLVADVTNLLGGAGTVAISTTTPGAPDQLTGATGGTGTHDDAAPVSQGGQGAGQAPIGAFVTVATPATLTVDVSAVVTHAAGYALDSLSATREDIETRIADYVNGLAAGDDVILKEVEAAIVTAPGVYDVSGVEIDGSAANLTVGALEVPVADTITLTEV